MFDPDWLRVSRDYVVDSSWCFESFWLRCSCECLWLLLMVGRMEKSWLVERAQFIDETPDGIGFEVVRDMIWDDDDDELGLPVRCGYGWRSMTTPQTWLAQSDRCHYMFVEFQHSAILCSSHRLGHFTLWTGHYLSRKGCLSVSTQASWLNKSRVIMKNSTQSVTESYCWTLFQGGKK
jgi:hypothetical protein